MKKIVVAWVCAVIGMAAIAPADTLKLKDGRTYEGVLIKKDARKVTFEVRGSGIVYTKDFDASDVDVIVPGALKQPSPASAPATPKPSTDAPAVLKSTETKPPAARPADKPVEAASMPCPPACPALKTYSTPTYYVIPLHGEVGKTILTNMLKQSLDDAVARKPTVVVLELDSPGGLCREATDIIEIIRQYSDKLRIVVYSSKSFSAAAVLAFSCKEIYFKPGGLMGAATSYVPDNLFLPAKLEEKMQSVWRATARSAAESGGHDPGMAQAMIENKNDLYLVEENGKKRSVESKSEKSGKLICHGGNVLTMTANEAVEYGLAKGVAEDYAALGKQMGFDGWQECQGWGSLLAKHWETTWSKFDEEMKRIGRDFRKHMEAADRAKPDGTIYYYGGSGNLTSKSQEKWRTAMLERVTHLRAAVKSLKEAIALTQNMEQLKSLRDDLQDLVERLSAEADDGYKKSGRTNIAE